MPRPTFPGADAFDFLIRALDKTGRLSFFIPARESRKAYFMRYAWRSQPAPYVAEAALLEQALHRIGADEERVEQGALNAMRRFMPTAAFLSPSRGLWAVGRRCQGATAGLEVGLAAR